MHLQPDIQHHGRDDVEVGEVDAKPPGQVEEDQQGPGEPLGEDHVRADGGRLRESDGQLRQGRHARPRRRLSAGRTAHGQRLGGSGAPRHGFAEATHTTLPPLVPPCR